MSSFDGLASARPVAELRGAAPLVVGSGWSGVISAGGGLPSGVTGTSCTSGVLWGAVCCAEVAVPVNAASTAMISIADRSLFLMRCSLVIRVNSTQGNLLHPHYIELSECGGPSFAAGGRGLLATLRLDLLASPAHDVLPGVRFPSMSMNLSTALHGSMAFFDFAHSSPASHADFALIGTAPIVPITMIGLGKVPACRALLDGPHAEGGDVLDVFLRTVRA
jgi:hypothetical protein